MHRALAVLRFPKKMIFDPPYCLGDSRLLERIQWKWSRSVREVKDLPYHDRLFNRNLYSFQRCLLCGYLILTYKILYCLFAVVSGIPSSWRYPVPWAKNWSCYPFSKIRGSQAIFLSGWCVGGILWVMIPWHLRRLSPSNVWFTVIWRMFALNFLIDYYLFFRFAGCIMYIQRACHFPSCSL